MLATIIASRPDRTQVQQIESPTVKDCLVAWAGKVDLNPDSAEARTRLRGDMADFDRPPLEGFGNVWRLEVDLGDGQPAMVVVVETVRNV